MTRTAGDSESHEARARSEAFPAAVDESRVLGAENISRKSSAAEEGCSEEEEEEEEEEVVVMV